jgi:hypothetical protein
VDAPAETALEERLTYDVWAKQGLTAATAGDVSVTLDAAAT